MNAYFLESVRLKISEWLDIAGVELDKRLDEQSPEFANLKNY